MYDHCRDASLNAMNPNIHKSICIIGSGAAGLITAYTLIQDGFTKVHILTQDSCPGGVWEYNKVYSGVFINNVYGDYRFSSMQMPRHPDRKPNDTRLSAEDMLFYMEKFADTLLKDRICYNTQVVKVRRAKPPYIIQPPNWIVTIKDKDGVRDLGFDRVVLCTGVRRVLCGARTYLLSHCLLGMPRGAHSAPIRRGGSQARGFRGPVVHSSDFRMRLDDVLSAVRPVTDDNPGSVVVIGGGKSAQDIAAYLAHEGRQRNVSMIFEKTDAFVASSAHIPDWIRKSRLIGILSPHIDIKTGYERFLHKTWLGGKLVRSTFSHIQEHSYKAFHIPLESPLRRAQDIFWSLRVNDEVQRRNNGFHALANEGKIGIIAPARAVAFGEDGHSIVLSDGSIVRADAIVLATGYKSSWTKIFDEETMNEVGLGKYPPQYVTEVAHSREWQYTSLKNPPTTHPGSRQWSSCIYRGIVPAKNILERDLAINGAVFSTNNGFVFETTAHWISSYFLGDSFLEIPRSPKVAIEVTERATAWLRRRYPDMLHWTNESHCADIAFWSWPQYADDLLEDMGLTSGPARTGGNWLTWPFKVIDIMSISSLGWERQMKRMETV
ncbi:FAD/NAD-P-binding domain-containing protein [Hymenopellis radicata]|nr:FAD/NAD-P-binding domain-containing protein [Hymenopellis radicata]